MDHLNVGYARRETPAECDRA